MLTPHRLGDASATAFLAALAVSMLAVVVSEQSIESSGSRDDDSVQAEVPVERVGAGGVDISSHAAAGPADGSAAMPAEPRPDIAKMCPDLDDENGRWEGSRLVGGNYSLKCAPGFKIQGRGGRTARLTCPESAEWREELKCEDVDDCVKLKYGCGAKGMCVEKTNSYECNCEKGSHRHLRDGEIYCGSRHSCGGHSCGAHGVCVDIRGDVAEYDTKANTTGNTTSNATGSNVSRSENDRRLRVADSADSYRCECSAGFFDDGMKCAPLDCGELDDELGTWSGGTTFGDEYTLACPEDAFVWGGSLANVSMSCGSGGRWLSKPVCVSPKHEKEKAVEEAAQYWFCFGMALLCVVCAALASGLTLGLTSIDLFQLKLIAETRPEDCGIGKDITESKRKQERKALTRKQHYAKKLEPLVSDHHLLLVTLLLFNTVANEALPIFLEDLLPAWAAVVLSVTVVLICGEILPSAVFTGPNQFAIASACAPLVRFLQRAFHPVAHPLARLLDRMLHDSDGHSSSNTKYSRAQIQTFLRMQAGTNAIRNTPPASGSSPTFTKSDTADDTLPLKQDEELNDRLSDSEEGVDDEDAEHVLSQAEYLLIHGSLSLKDAPCKDHAVDNVFRSPHLDRQPRGVAFVEATSTGDDALAAGLLTGGPAAVVIVRPGRLPKTRPLAAAASPTTSCPANRNALMRLLEASVVGVLQPAELLRAGSRKLEDVVVELNRSEPPTVDVASSSALEALRILAARGQPFALAMREREGQRFAVGVIPRSALLRRIVHEQHKHHSASRSRGSASEIWAETDSDIESKDDELPPQPSFASTTPFATGPTNWRQRFRRPSMSKSSSFHGSRMPEGSRRIGSQVLPLRTYSRLSDDGVQPSLGRTNSVP